MTTEKNEAKKETTKIIHPVDGSSNLDWVTIHLCISLSESAEYFKCSQCAFADKYLPWAQTALRAAVSLLHNRCMYHQLRNEGPRPWMINKQTY